MSISKIRIVNEDLLGRNARVYYYDRDGNETEISDVVQKATITLDLGHLTTASLETIKVEFDVVALGEEKNEAPL